MKRIVPIAGGFLLVFAAVFCVIGSLVTAFSFNVELGSLYPIWLIAALALAVIASFLRGKGVAILAAPFLVFFLIKLPEILEGAKWALFSITSQYNAWLNVPVFFQDANASEYELTLFFIMLGLLLAFALSASVCLQRSAFLTITITAPLVLLTVVLKGTQPDIFYPIGLLVVYIAMVVSSSLHPDNIKLRGSAVFPAIAIALVLLGVAYLIAPPHNYTRSEFIESLDGYLRNTGERIGVEANRKGVGWPFIDIGEWRFDTKRTAISDAGPRTISDQKLLEVTATHDGTFYLKGFSMQTFDEGEWRSELVSDGHVASAMPTLIASVYSELYQENAPRNMAMTIDRVFDATGVFYQPYYPHYNYGPLHSGSNPYTVDFIHSEESILKLHSTLLADGFTPTAYFGDDTQVSARSEYLQIDSSTAEGLRQIAIDAGIDPSADRAEIADKVAAYISSSGIYTLNPNITPEGEDFALYFLQTSKRGYCIHFATAATLMFRALDIPARYTSGFIVTIPRGQAGSVVEVTDRGAHAWVEVFYEDVGWLPLEVTPAGFDSGIPQRSPHSTDTGTASPEVSPSVTESPSTSPGVTPPSVSTETDTGDGPGSSPETEGQPGVEEEQQADPWSVAVLIPVFCVAAFILAVATRFVVMRIYRKKQFALADTNASVLYIWRYASRISRKDSPPEEMEQIALKARFSHHRITEDERTAMIEGAENHTAAVCKDCNLPRRIWLLISR